MSRKLRGEEYSRRAVRAADDADGSGLGAGKAQQHAAQEGNEHAQLCGSAQQQAHRVCEQGTEVGHRSDAHEDKAREDTALDARIYQAQDSDVIPVRALPYCCTQRVDNAGRVIHKTCAGQVCKQDTERDGKQQKRFEFFGNGQIEQDERHEDHYALSPLEHGETRAFPEAF